MLKWWKIENFKSIKECDNISFAPLTIFTGANSSGKSTVIQSILLLKQTLGSGSASRPLALNGPILKLGAFNDVLHVNASDPHIIFGAGFDFSWKGEIESQDAVSTSYFHRQLRDKFSEFSFELSFDVVGKSELSQLQPSMKWSKFLGKLSQQNEDEVKVSKDNHEENTVSIEIRRRDEEGLLKDLPDNNYVEDEEIVSKYDVFEYDKNLKSELANEFSTPRIKGIKTWHFLPQELIVEHDSGRKIVQKMSEAICSLNTSLYRVRDISEEIIPRKVLDIVDKVFQNHDILNTEQLGLFDNIEDSQITISEFLDGLRYRTRSKYSPNQIRLKFLHQARLELSDHQSEIEEILGNTFGSKIEKTTYRYREVDNIGEGIFRLLSQLTKYLGPLRDEPKPLYPLEGLSDPLDVGYKGEHTAAVLELHKDRNVSYIPPQYIENGTLPENLTTNTLHNATAEWLSYLGVAENVLTSDMGKFGHGMQVFTEGLSKGHDLTNVGVGVSQVLPIVVMSLLSNSQSILIFEQPELHLHPKVQSRLADFFISMSLQGKQCIVETHSEYMIHRIRRRVAEFEGNKIKKLVEIYFVERNQGNSFYRPLDISNYGAIADWPNDFFDEADKEAENIIKAAMKKNKNRQDMNKSGK